VSDPCDDSELICSVQRGDSGALGALYDRYAREVHRVACRLLEDGRDAEDLVHDVFLQVWSDAGSFDPDRGSFRAWLMVRARTRSIDRLRRLRRVRQYLVGQRAEPEAYVDGRDVMVRIAEAGRAREAIEALPLRLQDVVNMVYVAGFTCAEAAAHLEIPLGTVKSRLSTARDQLRIRVDPGRVVPEPGTEEG